MRLPSNGPGKTLSFSVVLIAGFLVLGQGCTRMDPVWEIQEGQKRVLTTFPPLYCFAQNVAGEHASVVCLVTEQSPHEYTPQPHEVLKVRLADVFFAHGMGLDEKVNKLVNNASNKKLKFVEVAEKAIPEQDQRKIDKVVKHEGHQHGNVDPHVWLSPTLAAHMVQYMSETLAEVDPAHKKDYDRRAKEYVKKLQDLKEYGSKKLAGKKNPQIISTHDALYYFVGDFMVGSFEADRVNKVLLGTIQVDPGKEPDGVALAELMKKCTKKYVVIACEPQFPKGSAEMLQNSLQTKGVTAELVEIDTLETAPPELDADYYLIKMRENLDNLAEKLK